MHHNTVIPACFKRESKRFYGSPIETAWMPDRGIRAWQKQKGFKDSRGQGEKDRGLEGWKVGGLAKKQEKLKKLKKPDKLNKQEKQEKPEKPNRGLEG